MDVGTLGCLLQHMTARQSLLVGQVTCARLGRVAQRQQRLASSTQPLLLLHSNSASRSAVAGATAPAWRSAPRRAATPSRRRPPCAASWAASLAPRSAAGACCGGACCCCGAPRDDGPAVSSHHTAQMTMPPPTFADNTSTHEIHTMLAHNHPPIIRPHLSRGAEQAPSLCKDRSQQSRPLCPFPHATTPNSARSLPSFVNKALYTFQSFVTTFSSCCCKELYGG